MTATGFPPNKVWWTTWEWDPCRAFFSAGSTRIICSPHHVATHLHFPTGCNWLRAPKQTNWKGNSNGSGFYFDPHLMQTAKRGTLLRHVGQSHCILALEHENEPRRIASKFQLCLRIDLELPPSESLTQGFKNKSTILPHKFTSIAEGSAILSMCALAFEQKVCRKICASLNVLLPRILNAGQLNPWGSQKHTTQPWGTNILYGRKHQSMVIAWAEASHGVRHPGG